MGNEKMIKFNLVKKDYANEDYESEDILFSDVKIKFAVSMSYHTFLKYWTISYYWKYNKNYNTPAIRIINKDKRKDARGVANLYMEIASLYDINLLNNSEFYENEIKGVKNEMS